MGGKYEQWLRSHAVHASLENLKESLAKAMASEQAVQFLADLEKVQKTAFFIHENIDSVDADLIPISTLNSINGHVTNALTQINNFLANYQAQDIDSAISQLDAAIAFVPVLSSLAVSPKNLKNLNLAKAQLDSFVKYVSEKTKDFDKNLADISNNYIAISSIAENSKYASESATKQSNELIASLQKQNQDIISSLQKQGQDAIATIQQHFSDTQAQRSSMFDAAVSEYKAKFDSELDKTLIGHNKRLEEHFADYDKKLESIINDSEFKHERIIELYGIVAGDSVGGEYAKTAQGELETANSLRKKGIICLCFGIGWVLLCIFVTILNGISFEVNLSAYHAIPAATVTFIILSIGAYLLFQSEKHREISLWANQINLELKAFEPFIYSIEDEGIKIELRQALTNQLFGQIKNPKNAKGRTETGLPIEKFFEILEKLPDYWKNKIFPA